MARTESNSVTDDRDGPVSAKQIEQFANFRAREVVAHGKAKAKKS